MSDSLQRAGGLTYPLIVDTAYQGREGLSGLEEEQLVRYLSFDRAGREGGRGVR
jgi:hypothetical protein